MSAATAGGSGKRSSTRGEPTSRRRLNQADVVQAAADVLTERGLRELTMATVAARLGVTPMALYVHVDDKDHLLALVRDATLATVEVPDRSAGPWHERLRLLHRRVTAAMHHYPGLTSHLHERKREHYAAEIARLLDGYLQILLDAGFDPEAAVKAYTGFFYLAMGATDVPAGGPATPAAVPPHDVGYPAMAAVAEVATAVSAQELREYALDVYIAGLQHLHRRRAR